MSIHKDKETVRKEMLFYRLIYEGFKVYETYTKTKDYSAVTRMIKKQLDSGLFK